MTTLLNYSLDATATQSKSVGLVQGVLQVHNEVVLSNTRNKPTGWGAGNQKRSLLGVRGLGSGYLADQLPSLLGLFQIETALRQPPHAFHPRQVGLVLQLQEKNPALIRHMDADWVRKILFLAFIFLEEELPTILQSGRTLLGGWGGELLCNQKRMFYFRAEASSTK